MAILPIDQFSVLKPTRIQTSFFTSSNTTSRWKRQRISTTVIRSCGNRSVPGTEKNHYELLGVSVDSSSQQIKDAYRKLQKIYHPDIAGQKGHEFTLRLNQAYTVLMKEDLRRQYDTSIGEFRIGFERTGRDVESCSSWNGPLRPHALFVDETACVGCGECAYHASNTFVMDEALGCARVKVQYGDDAEEIEVSVDSCPVNCIHWIDSEDLGLLESLIRPKPKEGFGVFGQGWERPANVFKAAETFKKQVAKQAKDYQGNSKTSQQARESAYSIILINCTDE
ncbi:unnamed protein product [Linum tenue]|uniref:J domain-containing protein n=1 Tax=Linum tenue TaxID=586396 RepID=A0AAV0N9H1_9ROSI|nr:unnamed protein product [Linum tenue]